MSNRRQSAMGISPLLYSDIYAFFRLIDVVPTQDELRIIEMLDHLTMQHYAKKQAKEQQRQSQKQNKKSK